MMQGPPGSAKGLVHSSMGADGNSKMVFDQQEKWACSGT